MELSPSEAIVDIEDVFITHAKQLQVIAVGHRSQVRVSFLANYQVFIETMVNLADPFSLWKRDSAFDHSLSLSSTLRKVIENIFLEYDKGLKDDVMSFENADQACQMHPSKVSSEQAMQQGLIEFERERKSFDNRHDVGMSSEDSSYENPKPPLKVIHFETSDSEESMSILNFGKENDDDYYYHHEDIGYSRDDQSSLPLWTSRTWMDGDIDCDKTPARGHDVKATSFDAKCMRCEAYDTHCKSAAENYRRVLSSYTNTVAELMTSFKKVLERYPELRSGSSDDHLHYMVQAALGRNNLVQEMVRLAAKQQVREAVQRKTDTKGAKCDHAIVSIHEALSTCNTDSETLRIILHHYINLYVQYIERWIDMRSTVSGDITVMEFITLTCDRPGLTHGEPWSEAKAYVARMLHKVGCVTPRLVGKACADALKIINTHLSSAPTDFDKRKRVVNTAIEDIRNRLDSTSQKWTWDAYMTDLYFDIRSDLTVLEALVGVGEMSVKTLLYERSMLVSQVRKLMMNEGCLQLQVGQTQSQLRDSITQCRLAELKTLH